MTNTDNKISLNELIDIDSAAYQFEIQFNKHLECFRTRHLELYVNSNLVDGCDEYCSIKELSLEDFANVCKEIGFPYSLDDFYSFDSFEKLRVEALILVLTSIAARRNLVRFKYRVKRNKKRAITGYIDFALTSKVHCQIVSDHAVSK